MTIEQAAQALGRATSTVDGQHERGLAKLHDAARAQVLPERERISEGRDSEILTRVSNEIERLAAARNAARDVFDAFRLVDLIELPAGSFWMGTQDGDEREKPRHEKKVGSFWIAKTVVTQAQYRQVLGERRGSPQGDELPVNDVSWFDALRFCNALSEREGYARAYELDGTRVTWNEQANGYRLPTEAEWEYAARAGTDTAWSFGDDEAKLGEYAWFDGNAGKTVHPVAQKKPNPWGLYDLHGNVWEWCWDWFGPYPDPPPVGSARVVRGGSSWSDSRYARSAYRLWSALEARFVSLGFRVVRGPLRQP